MAYSELASTLMNQYVDEYNSSGNGNPFFTFSQNVSNLGYYAALEKATTADEVARITESRNKAVFQDIQKSYEEKSKDFKVVNNINSFMSVLTGNSNNVSSEHRGEVARQLDVLNYGDNQGSFHLNDVVDEDGNVKSHGIDYYIENASTSAEKAVYEKRKQEMLAERDSLSAAFGTDSTSSAQIDLATTLDEKRLNFTTLVANGASGESVNKAAEELAISEILYFDKYGTSAYSGEEYAKMTEKVNAMKAAYPDYENYDFSASEPMYDSSGRFTGMSGSKIVKKEGLSVEKTEDQGVTRSAGDNSDEKTEGKDETETKTETKTELKPWEKGLGVGSMSKDEQKEYMSYFETKNPNGLAKEFTDSYTETDFTREKTMYLECKRQNGLELTDDEKIWSISQYENKQWSINSADDAKAHEEAQALATQYKKELVEKFDSTTPTFNTEAQKEAYNTNKEIVAKYKTELGVQAGSDTAEKSADEQLKDSKESTEQTEDGKSAAGQAGDSKKATDKPDPYAFTNPERPEKMSDADYERLCTAAKQSHINSVNEKMADEVISGKYGVGQERIQALEAQGYDYSQIQARVNEKMSGYSKSTTVAKQSEPKPDTKTKAKNEADVETEVKPSARTTQPKPETTTVTKGYTGSQPEAKTASANKPTSGRKTARSLDDEASADETITRTEKSSTGDQKQSETAPQSNQSEVSAYTSQSTPNAYVKLDTPNAYTTQPAVNIYTTQSTPSADVPESDAAVEAEAKTVSAEHIAISLIESTSGTESGKGIDEYAQYDD